MKSMKRQHSPSTPLRSILGPDTVVPNAPVHKRRFLHFSPAVLQALPEVPLMIPSEGRQVESPPQNVEPTVTLRPTKEPTLSPPELSFAGAPMIPPMDSTGGSYKVVTFGTTKVYEHGLVLGDHNVVCPLQLDWASSDEVKVYPVPLPEGSRFASTAQTSSSLLGDAVNSTTLKRLSLKQRRQRLATVNGTTAEQVQVWEAQALLRRTQTLLQTYMDQAEAATTGPSLRGTQARDFKKREDLSTAYLSRRSNSEPIRTFCGDFAAILGDGGGGAEAASKADDIAPTRPCRRASIERPPPLPEFTWERVPVPRLNKAANSTEPGTTQTTTTTSTTSQANHGSNKETNAKVGAATTDAQPRSVRSPTGRRGSAPALSSMMLCSKLEGAPASLNVTPPPPPRKLAASFTGGSFAKKTAGNKAISSASLGSKAMLMSTLVPLSPLPRHHDGHKRAIASGRRLKKYPAAA